MDDGASGISEQIYSLNKTIAERRTLDKSVFTGESRNNAGAKRYAHRFERARECRMHALVGRGIRGQSFLGIPGKVTFDNKILDHIPMGTWELSMEMRECDLTTPMYDSTRHIAV